MGTPPEYAGPNAATLFKQVVVGVAHDPQVVAIVRALLFYGLPIALGALLAYVNNWTDPRLLPLVPILGALIRAIEGAMDKALKADQNNYDPPPVAGSGDGVSPA